jgi:putative protease
MSRSSNRPEIVAPAGTPAKLQTALHFGADAVYLGLTRGSLRAFAGNFTLDELEWALRYAHERGRRVYVCVNVQPFDDDLPALIPLLRDLGRLKPDGLVVADPGVLELARQQAPALPLHLSTQASVTNAAAARFWFTQGVRRIVVARELSVERLGHVVQGSPPGCDVEAFIHGAVCIAYSGRCLLSGYWSAGNQQNNKAKSNGSSSASRQGATRDARSGSCAQACRWPYARLAVEDRRRPGQWNPLEPDARGTHFFDAKDLCGLPLLDRVLATGLRALKIEGRTRSAHYVGVTVDVYRHAVDRLAEGDLAGFQQRLETYLAELARPANRGFSTHFLGDEQDAPTTYNPEGSYPDGRYGYVGEIVGSEENGAGTGDGTGDGDGLWLRCRNAVEPGTSLEIRDRGLLTERVTLHRVDTRDERDLPRARHDQVIRIPGPFSSAVGPGALVRRAP